MKLIASVLVIILLLGISANTAAYAQQVITPQGLQQPQPQPQPISTVQPQPQPQPQVQNAVIDLNTPILQSSNSTLNSSLLSNNNCFNGVVVYQTSLITNQPVPVCVTSDMMNTQLLSAWSQLFNIDFTVKSDNNNNDNDDDDDDNNHKRHNNNNDPDRDCLFNPSLLKCASDNGGCPDGFNQNEDGNCVPEHRNGCPDGYHGEDDDETGKCIDDKKGCPDNMEFRSDGKTCTYKQEESNNNDETAIPLVDLTTVSTNPVIPLVDTSQQEQSTVGTIEEPQTQTETEPQTQTTEDQSIQQDQDTNRNGSDDDEEDTDEDTNEKGSDNGNNNEGGSDNKDSGSDGDSDGGSDKGSDGGSDDSN